MRDFSSHPQTNPLVTFSYKNRFYSGIKMASFVKQSNLDRDEGLGQLSLWLPSHGVAQESSSLWVTW